MLHAVIEQSEFAACLIIQRQLPILYLSVWASQRSSLHLPLATLTAFGIYFAYSSLVRLNNCGSAYQNSTYSLVPRPLPDFMAWERGYIQPAVPWQLVT